MGERPTDIRASRVRHREETKGQADKQTDRQRQKQAERELGHTDQTDHHDSDQQQTVNCSYSSHFEKVFRV